jgi:mRNA interferase MazF
MTSYKFGDVVLVPFPFTDQSATKRRPAVIISNADYHNAYIDVIVMAITSQARASSVGEVTVTRWREAGLLKPSTIKPVITTLDPMLILRKLGELATEDQEALITAIPTIFG